jgi:hypothetical protein
MKELRALTPQELAVAEERLWHPAPGSRTAAAKEYGIDLSLLARQLRLSPDQRVRDMEQACRQMLQILGAARRPKPTLNWSESVEAELYGCRVRTLSLADLIKSKRAAGRAKDLQVLPELESIQEALDQNRKE